MNTNPLHRHCGRWLLLFVGSAGAMSAQVVAAQSFISFDNRLPNPDRPYEMTSGTVVYQSPPIFALYDLQFQAFNPAQLDFPTLNKDGNWEFDSSFDITYRAIVSFGLGPAHPVTGIGTAHATGIAPGGREPKVYDSEFVALNLYGLSPIPEFIFRESPTLRSSGVTTVEDACPMCASPVPHNRITSFFDIFTEVSFNSGGTWTPASAAIHVEQAPNSAVGDYDGNGIVDAGDYTTWRDGLGTNYSQSDYDVWLSHFGQTAGSGAAVNASATVPEPTTLWLLLAGFLTMCCRRG